MQPKELAAWLTLSFLPGIHSRLFNTLLERFESPAAFLQYKNNDLSKLGLVGKFAGSFSTFQKNTNAFSIQQKVAAAYSWMEQADNTVITLKCPEYPPLLREIPDPPPLLYLKGNHSLLGSSQLAMVGSRNPTRAGQQTARAFASSMAHWGITVCSGMAAGIDAQSHWGALESGTTIAVLGTGVDKVYPSSNKELYEVICEKGLLVSELPLGANPVPRHFPARNRIISGLSAGVLIVEAALKSGSLITAKFALEQGREVFAVPGSIHSPLSKGCHLLIREGAKLVESSEHILEEFTGCLGLLDGENKGSQKVADTSKRLPPGLSDNARHLLTCLSHEPENVEQLIDTSRLDVPQINAAISELELRHLIERETTGYTLKGC